MLVLSILSTSLFALANDDVITVTATKSEAPLRDVPASVSVLSSGDAGGIAALTSGDALAERLAGLEVAVANGTQAVFQIRGIGAVDHQALTPGGAAVYVDGVFLATNVQTGILLYDMDRAEVLRGPQGTLYGRNASSGAVNFLANRPGTDAANYVTVRGGSFDLVDVTAATDIQLSAQTDVRLAARHLRQNAVIDNVTTNDAFPAAPDDAGGMRDETGLRVGVSHRPHENTEILFRAHAETDKGVNPAPRNSALDVGDHEISVGPDGVQDTDTSLFGASLEWSFDAGPWSIVSLTAYEGYDQNYGFDFDGTPAPFDNPSLNANLRYDREFAQWSEEFRAVRTMDAHRILLGATATIDTFDQDYLIWCGDLDAETLRGSCPYVGAPGRVGPNPPSSGTPLSLLTRIEQDRTTAALFTRNDIAIGAATTLTLGGRLTYEKIEGEGFGRHFFDDGTDALNNRDGLGLAIGENTTEDTRGTYQVALRHAVTPQTSLWASVGTGYKSGGFNGEVANNALHYSDEGLFGAEEVTAYEAGIKGQHDTVRYALTAFYQDYDAPQARIFVAFPQPDGSVITSNSLSNLESAVSQGAELEIDWQATPALAVRGAATLLDTEIVQTDTGGAIGNAALFDGKPLPFAPEASATLSARYMVPLPHGQSLIVDGHAKYRSDFFLDAEGRDDRMQEGYTLVDAGVTWSLPDQNLDLRLAGRNLTDEDYAVSGFGFIGYNTFRGAPRTLSLSATLRF